MPEVFNDASVFYDFLMTELKSRVEESDISPYSARVKALMIYTNKGEHNVSIS